MVTGTHGQCAANVTVLGGPPSQAASGFLWTRRTVLANAAVGKGSERAAVAPGGRRQRGHRPCGGIRLGRGRVLCAGPRHDFSVVPFRRGGKQLLVLLSHL